MRLNTHHITYNPAWTVEIQQYQHRCISIIQRTNPTNENYAILINFLHALQWEAVRYRMSLDAGIDLNKEFGK